MRIEFLTAASFAQACAEFMRQGLSFKGHETQSGEFVIILQGF